MKYCNVPEIRQNIRNAIPLGIARCLLLFCCSAIQISFDIFDVFDFSQIFFNLWHIIFLMDIFLHLNYARIGYGLSIQPETTSDK